MTSRHLLVVGQSLCVHSHRVSLGVIGQGNKILVLRPSCYLQTITKATVYYYLCAFSIYSVSTHPFAYRVPYKEQVGKIGTGTDVAVYCTCDAAYSNG